MTKSGVARIVFLIFFFLFMILYSMQAAGYNEYSQNKKNMLTAEQIEQFEQDVAAGKDVGVEDYLKSQEKQYNNAVSQAGLTISYGIENAFNESMNALFKMLSEAVESSASS